MIDPSSLELVRLALAEDLGDAGDVTTNAVIPQDATGRAVLIAREDAVLAGTEIFEAVFRELDADIDVAWESQEGDDVAPGEIVVRVEGSLRAIIAAERTALNFIQRLSGVATAARMFVRAANAPAVQVRDTRKTAPGMRVLEKKAARAGGAVNHRMGLYEGIFLKDNHIAACGGLRAAIDRARAVRPDLNIRVECESLEQVREAVEAKADEILLDNMDVETLKKAVEIAGGRAELEASGGVTLKTVRAIAATGVDAVSAGAITHSAPAVDFSLEMEAIDAPRG